MLTKLITKLLNIIRETIDLIDTMQYLIKNKIVYSKIQFLITSLNYN